MLAAVYTVLTSPYALLIICLASGQYDASARNNELVIAPQKRRDASFHVRASIANQGAFQPCQIFRASMANSLGAQKTRKSEGNVTLQPLASMAPQIHRAKLTSGQYDATCGSVH